MTRREELVSENLLEDMTFEAYKFLVIKEYLAQMAPWSQHEVEMRIGKLPLRELYDQGTMPLVVARTDIQTLVQV